MARSDKRLEAMRANPRGNWSITDVQALCRTFGLACFAPRRGDHYKVSHPSQEPILTVPAHRPINPVYIRKLVKFVEDVIESDDERS